MTTGQLLLEALNLMFVGMLCVGAFLSLLVFIIPLLERITPDEPLPERPALPTGRQDGKQMPAALVAAISAAVHQYRQQHK